MLNSTHGSNINYLMAGDMCEEHYQMLIELSKIRSKKITAALKEYLVNGKARGEICEQYDVDPGNFSRKLAELQTLSKKIVTLYPYYLTCLSKKI